MRVNLGSIAIAALATLTAIDVGATPARVVHAADFEAAVGTPSVSIDFESTTYASPETRIPSGNLMTGVVSGGSGAPMQIGRLQYDAPDCQSSGVCYFIVSQAFDLNTTSGSRYLGADDPGNYNQLIGGRDSFSIAFTESDGVSAFALNLIASDPVGGLGALLLDVNTLSGLFTFEYGETIESILPDGGLVYFLGVHGAESPITSVTLRFDPAVRDTFLYSVDDVLIERSIPEAPGLALLLAGAPALVFTVRRRPIAARKSIRA